MNRSEQINELAMALSKAQLHFKPIVKKVENKFYSTETKKAMYADLAAVIAATQPALAENGLTVVQFPQVDRENKEAGVRSLLLHSSGQWMEDTLMLPATAKVKEYPTGGGSFTWGVKFDSQTVGIATTYARRYSYGSIIGVAAEDDDDANGISTTETTKAEDDKAYQANYEKAVEAARNDPSAKPFKKKVAEHMEKSEMVGATVPKAEIPTDLLGPLQASIDHTKATGVIAKIIRLKKSATGQEYRRVDMILKEGGDSSFACFANHKYPDGSTFFSLLDMIADTMKETKKPVQASFIVRRNDKGSTIERPTQLGPISFDDDGVPEIHRDEEIAEQERASI